RDGTGRRLSDQLLADQSVRHRTLGEFHGCIWALQLPRASARISPAADAWNAVQSELHAEPLARAYRAERDSRPGEQYLLHRSQLPPELRTERVRHSARLPRQRNL